MQDSTIDYSCSHDPNDPDHLTCTQRTQNDTDSSFQVTEASRVTPAISIKDLSIDGRTARTFADLIKERYEAYYHPERKQFILHRIIDTALPLLVIALVGFIAYIQFAGPFNFRQIDLTITQESQKVVSGESASFIINIKNKSGKHIKNPVLSLHLPKAFELIEPHSATISSAIAIPLEKQFRKNETLTIHVKGLVVGAIQEHQNLTATVRGEFEDGSAAESNSKLFSYEIEDSALEVNGLFPEHIIASSPFEGAIEITNRSSRQQQDLILSVEMPSDFVATEANEYKKDIQIERIEPHDTYRLPIKGTLKRSSSSGIVAITLFSKKAGTTIIQRQTELSLTAQKKELDLTLTLKDSLKSLAPGKPATAVLSWKNSSDSALTNMRLGIDASGFGITDASLISATAIKTKPLTLLWTRNQESSLATLAPSESHSLEFTIKPSAMHDITGISADSQLETTLRPFASYESNGTVYIITDDSLHIPIETSLAVKGSVRYFSPEGDQIGRGPLPPIYGKTTRYITFINPSSSIHPVENAVIKILLTPDARFSKILPHSYGETSLDSDSNALVWNIRTLTPTLGHQEEQVGIAIEIDFTPLSNKKISSHDIFKEVSFVGIDAITKTPLNHTSSIGNFTIELEKH